MTDSFKINGIEYICPDCCVFGDYGGAGSVGLANIRNFLEMADHVENMSFSMISDIQHENERDRDSVAGLQSSGWYELEKYFPEGGKSRTDPDVFHVMGGFSSEAVYVRADKYVEELTALADYPLLDDESISHIEIEWEMEAWESWLKDDLLRTLPEELAESVSNEAAFEAYREAMEECNEYPIPEHSGVFVDVDKIKHAFHRSLTNG